MCIGIPMRIGSLTGDHALCATRLGEQRVVDLALVGPQDIGTWLLVHIECAVSVIDAVTAGQIADALEAVSAAMNGQSVDHLFADLVGREPQLPDFLKERAS